MKVDIRKLRKITLSSLLGCGILVPGSSGAVTTAFLDTGLKAGVMSGVRVAGFDFVDNDNDPNDVSPIAHGTDQGQIFNDSAPAEKFMPLKTYSGESPTMLLSRGQAALDYANQRDVSVIAMNRLQPIDVGRLQTAVKKDTVIVINAGNQGLGTVTGSATLVPKLYGGGIISAGHEANGVIADKSNRPGTAYASHTITALHTSPRTSTSGTSFSMARVAAAAARVKSRDPHLSPKQVVDILKKTATDAGAPGVDAVYGHGLLDMSAALSAVGGTSVGDGGSSSSSSSSAVAAGALIVGVGLYALLKRDKKLKKTLILDEYGRSFWLDMSKATTRRSRTPTLNLVMASLDRVQETVMLTSTEDSRSYAVIDVNATALHAHNFTDLTASDEAALEDVSYSYHSIHRSGRQMSFGINDSQRGHFGGLAMLPKQGRHSMFLDSGAMTSPLMGFTDEGLSSAFLYSPVDKVTLKLGLSSSDDNQRWGLDSDSAFVETSYDTPKWGLSFQVGELLEKGSLFGGSSSGAFSVDSASTVALGMAGRYKLGQNTTLVGSYVYGLTDVKQKSTGILKNFSTIKTDSYGVGLVSGDFLRRGDAFGVGVFQPLRVRSGEVDSVVPYARDVEGNIYKNSGRYSLAPDGDERVFEAYYSFDIGNKATLGSHFLYRDEAYHDADSARERVVMFTLDRRF